MDEISSAEVLYGVKAIAKFLGLPKRAAQHQVDTGRIPHFRMGKNICARPSSLRAWLAELEQASAATDHHSRLRLSDRSSPIGA